jgi:hypothetical protein
MTWAQTLPWWLWGEWVKTTEKNTLAPLATSILCLVLEEATENYTRFAVTPICSLGDCHL